MLTATAAAVVFNQKENKGHFVPETSVEKKKKLLVVFAMQRHCCTKILKYFSPLCFWSLFMLFIHKVSSSVGYKITPYRDLKRPSGLKRSSSLRTPRGRRDSGSNESGKKKSTSSSN